MNYKSIKWICLITCLLIIFSCAGTRMTLNQKLQDMSHSYPVKGSINLIDTNLEGKIELENFDLFKGPGNDVIQLRLNNLTNQTLGLEYSVRFFDGSTQIESIHGNYKPLVLLRRNTELIKITLPDRRVNRFLLILKKEDN